MAAALSTALSFIESSLFVSKTTTQWERKAGVQTEKL